MNLQGKLIEASAPAPVGAIAAASQPGAQLPEADLRRIVDLTDTAPDRLKAMDAADFVPASFSTGRYSFEGVRASKKADSAAAPIRLDIANVGGTVTYVAVRDGKAPPPAAGSSGANSAPDSNWVAAATVGIVLLGVHGVLIWMAAWSLRQGKADRKGATRLAIATFAIQSLVWLCRAHFSTDPAAVMDTVIPALSFAAWLAAIVWMMYVGLEPIIRKRWPQSLVSWSRLLGGAWIDPRVGRDLLIGSLAGVLWVLAVQGLAWWSSRGAAPAMLGINELSMMGPLPALSVILNSLIAAILFTLSLTFLCTLPRFVLGNHVAASAAVFALLAVFFAAAMTAQTGVERSPVVAITGLCAGAIVGLVLTRLGLLTLLAAFFAAGVLWEFPLSLGGGWTMASSLAAIGVVIAVAVFGTLTSVGVGSAQPKRI